MVEPDILEGSSLLEFAEIPPVRIRTVSLEEHVAEKVHAYIRAYRDGVSSSRVKDLVDLVLIHAFASLKADRLRNSLEMVLESRGLQELPSTLPSPPRNWTGFYRKLAAGLKIDSDISEGYRLAGEMIDSVLAGKAQGHWDPKARSWRRAP